MMTQTNLQLDQPVVLVATSFRAEKLIGIFLCMCLLAISFPLVKAGSDDASTLLWSDLTVKQQQVLKRAEPRWNQLELVKKQKLVKNANRFISMTPQQRERFKRRMKNWQGMNKVERKSMLKEYRRFRDLPVEKRRALQKRYRQFQTMPAGRKKILRERWEKDRKLNSLADKIPTKNNELRQELRREDVESSKQLVDRQRSVEVDREQVRGAVDVAVDAVE